jgi:hypothetical protein
VPGGVEMIVDQPVGGRVQWDMARLAAFAGCLEVRHTFARMPKILGLSSRINAKIAPINKIVAAAENYLKQAADARLALESELRLPTTSCKCCARARPPRRTAA